MSVLLILRIKVYLGIASNALLMSMVVRRVRCGFLELIPSEICCVRLVSSVLVECSGLKPCWDCARGM